MSADPAIRDDRGRRERVRAAYERRRLARASVWAVPALALAAAAWSQGSSWALALGPLLGAALVWLRWRGGDAGRGAIVGLAAGLVPYAGILAWVGYGTCDPHLCLTVCGLSGVASAALMGRGLRRGSLPWALAAVGVASGVAALPCLALGASGLVVVPALVAVALPVRALARAAA